MYEETQEWFQENGIKSLQLYRGAGKARGTFDTASSWSESKQVASEFAEQSVNNIKRKGGTPQPSVFFKEVPVEDILIGHRAPGWENGKYGQQFEWIVMNRGGSGG